MKIGASGLVKLSQMICGEEPFGFFPYRSSSYLTRFFVDLDLDYVHDGSTRRHWVNDALVEINNEPAPSAEMPSSSMTKVIESLLHPDNYFLNSDRDRAEALKAMNKLLRSYDLTVKEQTNGQVILGPTFGESISTAHGTLSVEKFITLKPSVFNVPDKSQNERLVSVMMPFSSNFDGTFEAVKRVTDHMKLECLRPDNIWDNDTFMQDIFDLIYCAKAVVVDFTGRNPNVMYETGIAHTLGKSVIPITQSLNDIPSDLGHHRALKYLPNEEGYRDLSNNLFKRLQVVVK
ncbi:hypothetical protein [Sneathiella sp.]|jgi:hypothetical protein|uniref:hypothetical protein n=1 Tax=Sneathiella sp. TaxID=1964365 RepID=UPI0039E49932